MALLALLSALLTLAAAHFVGAILLPKNIPLRTFCAIGIGLCSFIALLFALFALHVAVRPVFIALLTAVALAGAAQLARVPWRRSATAARAWWARSSAFERLLALALLFFALLHIVGAGAPSIDADGLGYHLLVPKLWLESGGFSDIPWNMYAAWPLNFDLLYGAGLALKSQLYGKFLHALAGVLALALTYAWAKEGWGERAALLAALMVATTPMIGILSGIAYVDLFVLFYGLLMLALLLAWREDAHAHGALPLIAGVFAGALVGAKITGFAFAVPFGAFFLVVAWLRERSLSPMLKPVGLFALGAALLVVPWLVKSFVLLGNPVWPFLYDELGGAHWSPYAAQMLSNEVGAGLVRTPLSFALFPFLLTFKSTLLGEMSFIGAGYLSLCVLALALWWRERRPFDGLVLLFIALNLAAFFFLLHQTRYVVFLLPPLAGLCCAAAVRRWRPAWVGTLLLAFLLCTMALNSPFTLLYNAKSVPVALGIEPQDAYLARNLGAYAPIAWANANLPEDARVYTSSETRTFYLERDHMWGAPNRQALVDYSKIRTLDELERRLRELGVTHYLTTRLSQDYLRAISPAAARIEEDFVRERCRSLYESDDGLVCALT